MSGPTQLTQAELLTYFLGNQLSGYGPILGNPANGNASDVNGPLNGLAGMAYNQDILDLTPNKENTCPGPIPASHPLTDDLKEEISIQITKGIEEALKGIQDTQGDVQDVSDNQGMPKWCQELVVSTGIQEHS